MAEILVNARGLSSSSFALTGVSGWKDARVVQALDLAIGTYQWMQGNGVLPDAVFSVTLEGLVDYPSSADAFFSGRGTQALTVTGKTVTLDFTQVTSAGGWHIEGITGWKTASEVHTLNLLPGAYQLRKGDNTLVNETGFIVGRDGKISYPATDEGILLGAGTDTLTVRGLPIQLDLSGVTSSGGLHIPGITSWIRTDAQPTLNLLPGKYGFWQGNNNPVPELNFTVRRDGTLEYAATSEGLLSGAGSAALKAKGLPIQLDLTGVSSAGGLHIPGITSWIRTDANPTLNLLPGAYEFNLGSNLKAAETGFTVLRDGTVTYPGENDSVLTGRGTSSLALHGHAVALDARQLSIGGAFHLPGITNWLVATELQNLKLLKSSYQLIHSVTGAAAEAGFSVDAQGLFDYPDSSAHLLTGKGSSLLQIRGCGLGIDATAFPGTRVVLAPHHLEIDTGSGLPTTWHLLPQNGLRLDIYDTNPPRQVLFDLQGDGTVAFKAEYPFIGTTQQEGHVVLVLLGDEPLKVKVPCRRPVFLGRMS